MIDPIDHLSRAMTRAGGLSAFARGLDVQPSYIYAVLTRTKPPSTRVLDALGLERIVKVSYRRKRR